MVKELSAEELEAACRKKVHITVTSTAPLCTVLDELGVEYKIASQTQADIFAKVNVSQLAHKLAPYGCEILSMQEQDESLEGYYMSLVGGNKNA